MTDRKERIALIGGTGDMGTGLARRWAGAGYPIIIGSRDPGRARAAAAELGRRCATDAIEGLDNSAAAERGEIIVLTVPHANHRSSIEGIGARARGKIVIDTTAPLVPPKLGTVQLPEGGSAALIAQEILGPEVQVVSAFQNVSATHLMEEGALAHQVLISGNQRAARAKVIELAAAAGLTGWHAGPLANSVAAEALTSVLISINRHHRIDGAGIIITGRPKTESGD
jgi:hypothetical protein